MSFSLSNYLEDKKLFIIAEMSCNHGGSLEKAKKLISAAKWAGADAIKIQTYTPACMTLDIDRPEFYYQGGNNDWRGRKLWDIYRDAHTPLDWHNDLFSHSRKEGILLFSSPFSGMGVDLLESLGTPLYKLASFEVNHFPLVEKIARTGKPCLLSTGVVNEVDLKNSISIFKNRGVEDLGLLHCVSEYPADPETFYLKKIKSLNKYFSLPSGLSDHSLGLPMPVASIALGGVIIEKHFKLNDSDKTLDSSFSMSPKLFKLMVENCHLVKKSLDWNQTHSSQKKNAKGLSRSLFLVKDIKKGETFTEDHIGILRPGTGLPPIHFKFFLGKKARQDLLTGISLQLNHAQS